MRTAGVKNEDGTEVRRYFMAKEDGTLKTESCDFRKDKAGLVDVNVQISQTKLGTMVRAPAVR